MGSCTHHAASFPAAVRFRSSVSTRVINSIAGIRKRSGPKASRHARVPKSPVSAGRWSFMVIHCSVKEAMNRAVMENSIPAVEKGRTPPNRAPARLPVTHQAWLNRETRKRNRPGSVPSGVLPSQSRE